MKLRYYTMPIPIIFLIRFVLRTARISLRGHVFLGQVGATVLLLCLPSTLSAQPYARWISAGKYTKTLTSLNYNLKNAPDDIELNYYMGLLYAQPDPGIFDEDSSYKYYDRCLMAFSDLRDKKTRQRLLRIPLTPSVVRKNLNTMLSNAFRKAERENTAEAYHSFYSRFPQSKPAGEARQRRDMILFREIAVPGLPAEAYMAYLGKNPDCACRLAIADSLATRIYNDNNRYVLEFFVNHFSDHDLFYEMYERLYNIYRQDGELLTLIKFYSNTPKMPRTDKQEYDIALTMKAYYMGLTAAAPSRKEVKTGFGSRVHAEEQNDELNRRLNREGAQSGDLQFSLMWNNFNDIDLHVVDPNGEEIFFGYRRSASGGILDVDMNVLYLKGRYSDKPVENIFWPYGSAPDGHYKVKIVHYKNHEAEGCKDPTEFTVRIRCNGQDTLISRAISFYIWKPPMTVFEFDYVKPERYMPEFNDSIAKLYSGYIKDAAPSELAWVALQKLTAPHIRSGAWNDALELVSRFSSYFRTNAELHARTVSFTSLLRDDQYQITKESLIKINTAAEEYSPVISADEKTLYFCGRGREDNLGKEDIYIAQAAGNNWQGAKAFDYINTADENEAPLSVSTDGNTMLLFRGGDIYYARKTFSGWSPPQAFPGPINTTYWEGDAMLTADGKAIIFASNRPGGMNIHTEQNFYHGGSNYASDLYVSEWNNGQWQEPVNLGNAVNSMFCERSPYLHPDLKTLYFSSDGHCGLGDLDVFITRRISDTSWTAWSAPVNLGRSINTADADWGYRIPASGQWAYFSANNVNEGTQEDIFRFQLPAQLRPEAVVALSGQLNDQNGNPISAELHWVDLTTGEEAGISGSDPVTGQYYILLPAGRLYGYYADSGSYFSVSDHLDLQDEHQFKVVTKSITLYRITDLVEDGQALRINNLFFDYDKSTLRRESFPELNRLANIIQANPEINVEIMGHTDDRGSEDYNQTLSEARAGAVKEYLTAKGVPAATLQATGYGKNRPQVPNTSDQNRQMNRRVEFRFYR